MIQRIEPAAIIETGTYLGTTTEWLSALQLPVFSIEADPGAFGFAQARLAATPNVVLVNADSRTALRRLVDEDLVALRTYPIFVYLDAHWNEDLPLSGELEIIFQSLPKAVVMIDDFAVPDEPGYKFDDYGTGKALNLPYITATMQKANLVAYFPTLPADLETGARRGCVVLTQGDLPLGAIPGLRAVCLSDLPQREVA